MKKEIELPFYFEKDINNLENEIKEIKENEILKVWYSFTMFKRVENFCKLYNCSFEKTQTNCISSDVYYCEISKK